MKYPKPKIRYHYNGPIYNGSVIYKHLDMWTYAFSQGQALLSIEKRLYNEYKIQLFIMGKYLFRE
jgi:hypothetical protein